MKTRQIVNIVFLSRCYVCILQKFLFIIDGKKGNFDKIKSWLTGVQIPLSYTWSQKGSRK